MSAKSRTSQFLGPALRRYAAFLGLALSPFMASNAFGLDPGRHLSQYGHTAWRVQDGSLPGPPTSMAQTHDGYLWIGTNSGLVRFDGVKFTSFVVPDGEPLRNTSVASLYSDFDGSLWIGTGSDLEHWDGAHLTHFPQQRDYYFGVITKILRSKGGTLWFSRRRVHDLLGPICSGQDESVRCYNQSNGVSPFVVMGMLEDKDGSFWIHSDLSLFHWFPQTGTERERLINVSEYAGLQQIAFDKTGDVLMAMAQSGDRMGLAIVRNGEAQTLKVGNLDGQLTSALAIFLDSKGSLWVGTDSTGVYRVTGPQVDHYTSADGLSDNTVSGFFEDREGDVWVSTGQGIDRFRDIQTTTYSVREGLSNSSVGAVMAASDGSIWISNFHSLDVLHPDGTVSSRHGGKGFPGQPIGALTEQLSTSIAAGSGFPGQTVGSLLEDRKGRKWIGVDSGLEILDGPTFKRVQKPGPKLTGQITAMVEDRDGDVWAISVSPNPHGSLLHFVNEELKEEIPYERLPYDRAKALAADPIEGIWVYLTDDKVAHWIHGNIAEVIDLNRVGPNAPSLTALIALADGFVIGGSSMGLSVIRQGRSRALSTEQGLPCANIYSLTDTDSELWLYSECGALSIRHSEFDRWWTNPNYRPAVNVLDALDGIRPAAAAGTFITPTSTHSSDGKVWFANTSVLQMVDTQKAGLPSTPLLPVLVEQLIASGKSYSMRSDVILPPLTKDVQLDFTSPSFATPQRIHFKYRLDGVDDDWVDSETRRQAFYTGLSPGVYTFHVTASQGGHAWTDETIRIFRIPPRFYQTVWFTLSYVCTILLAIFSLFRLRLESEKRALRSQLQTRLDERERIARDLHDTLFQNIYGLLLAVDNSTNTLAEGDPTRNTLKQILQKSDQVLAESRKVVMELRSSGFTERSIGETLSEMCAELAKSFPLACRVVEIGTPEDLHPVVFDEVYNICREALFNAFRHSAGTLIEIEVIFERKMFSVRIRDDGIGIDDKVLREGGKPGHFGLRGMAERAKTLGARWTIRSKPGAGTEIELAMVRSVATGARRTGALWFGWLRRR